MGENLYKIILSLLAIALAASFLIWPNKWKEIFIGESTEKILKLEEENRKIEERNKIIDDSLMFYKKRYISDSLKVDSINNVMDSIDININLIDGKIKITKKELDRMKKESKDSKEIIEKIKNSPNLKSGDELLHSMDQKLKRIK